MSDEMKTDLKKAAEGISATMEELNAMAEHLERQQANAAVAMRVAVMTQLLNGAPTWPPRPTDILEARKVAEKFKAGKGFDLEDFKAQIGQMRKMGGIAGLMDKLPAELARAAQGASVDERKIARIEGIINSMTPAERAKPEILKASRKRRIATGAGVSVQEVNRLLNQFEQMQKMMKMMSKGGGLAKMMRGMKGMLPGMR